METVLMAEVRAWVGGQEVEGTCPWEACAEVFKVKGWESCHSYSNGCRNRQRVKNTDEC